MTVGIINIGDYDGAPYTQNYIKILEKNNIEFELLYWVREDKKYSLEKNHHIYTKKSDFNKSKVRKIKDFIGFSLWCRKIIKENNYSKLVILTSLTGVFLLDVLIRKYKGNYIFDIRDYSYENLNLYNKIMEVIIRNSHFTAISSIGFLQFLPSSNKYVINHNFVNSKVTMKKNNIVKAEPIKLVFIGALRYFDHQKKIISSLANDEKFELVYHGYGAEYEEYVSFCKKNNIKNVTFTGRYQEKNKYKLLQDADIINNSYMSDNYMEVKYAISNKYYDALLMCIPQLVETNTFKGDMVESKGLGISLDPNAHNFKELLIRYYNNLDYEELKIKCNKELKDSIEDNVIYLNKISQFFKEESKTT